MVDRESGRCIVLGADCEILDGGLKSDHGQGSECKVVSCFAFIATARDAVSNLLLFAFKKHKLFRLHSSPTLCSIN